MQNGIVPNWAQKGETMQLQPNEALVLIIYRNGDNPADYIVSVRQAEARLDGAGDFQLASAQTSVLNLRHESDPLIALQKAITKVREFQP